MSEPEKAKPNTREAEVQCPRCLHQREKIKTVSGFRYHCTNPECNAPDELRGLKGKM